MASTKITTAITAALLLLAGLSGCTQTAAVAGEPAPTTATSVSLAPQAQDVPQAPSPTVTDIVSTAEATATVPASPSGTSTTAAAKPATTKAATTKATTAKPATVPAKPATTAPAAPASTYKPPSQQPVLTLSCKWDGTRVTALAQWSGYPGIVMTVSAPGVSESSGIAVIAHRVNGLAGQHGTCTASGGGQSKSASA